MVDTVSIASLNKQASYSTGLNSARSAQKFYREEETASTKQLAEIIARDQITGGNEFGLSAPVIGYPYELDAQGNFLDARGYTIDKMAQLAREAGVDDSPFSPLKEIQEIFKQNPEMKQGFYISKDPKEAKATHTGRHYGYLFTIERKAKTGEEYISAHAIEIKGSIEELNHMMNLLSPGADADSIVSFTNLEQRSADSVASLILSSYNPNSESLLDEAFEERMQAYLANDLEGLQDKQEQEIQELTEFLESFFQSLPSEEIHDALEFVALYAGGLATALSIVGSEEEKGALFQALSELYHSEKNESESPIELQSFETPDRTIRLERPSNDIPQIHVGNRVIPLIPQLDSSTQGTPILFAKNDSVEGTQVSAKRNNAVGNFRSFERALAPEVIAVKRREKREQFIEAAAFELQKKIYKETLSKEVSRQKQIHEAPAQKEGNARSGTQTQSMRSIQIATREKIGASAERQNQATFHGKETLRVAGERISGKQETQHAESARLTQTRMVKTEASQSSLVHDVKTSQQRIHEKKQSEARMVSTEMTNSSSIEKHSYKTQIPGTSVLSNSIEAFEERTQTTTREKMALSSQSNSRIETVRSIVSMLSKNGLSESDIVSKLEARGQSTERIKALLQESQIEGTVRHGELQISNQAPAQRVDISHKLMKKLEHAISAPVTVRDEIPIETTSNRARAMETAESLGSAEVTREVSEASKNVVLTAEQGKRVQEVLRGAGVSVKVSEEILQSIERSQELLGRIEVASPENTSRKINAERRVQSIVKSQLKELGVSKEIIDAVLNPSPSLEGQTLLEKVAHEGTRVQLKNLREYLQDSKPLSLNDTLIEIIQTLKKEVKNQAFKLSTERNSKEINTEESQEEMPLEARSLEIEKETSQELEIDVASILLQAECTLEEVAKGTRLLESFRALEKNHTHFGSNSQSLQKLLKELTERPPEDQATFESIVAQYGLNKEDVDTLTQAVSKVIERNKLRKLIDSSLIKGAQREEIQQLLLTLEDYLNENAEQEDAKTHIEEETLIEQEALLEVTPHEPQKKASRFQKKTTAIERQRILEVLMAQFSDLTLFLSEELRRKILSSEYIFDFELHLFKLLQKSDLKSEEIALILEALQEFSNTRDIDEFKLRIQPWVQENETPTEMAQEASHPQGTRLS